jgi:hypothetical protein
LAQSFIHVSASWSTICFTVYNIHTPDHQPVTGPATLFKQTGNLLV